MSMAQETETAEEVSEWEYDTKENEQNVLALFASRLINLEN